LDERVSFDWRLPRFPPGNRKGELEKGSQLFLGNQRLVHSAGDSAWSGLSALAAATAHRLSQKLDLVRTPRNDCLLNRAEMELSILSRQCINRRFDSASQRDKEIAAWQIAQRERARSELAYHHLGRQNQTQEPISSACHLAVGEPYEGPAYR
jgi:hypothetical protein